MSLVDAIPQTIKEMGRIKAGGRAARGAYGQSLADIGQMVATIPGQIRNQEQQAQTSQLRDLQIKAATTNLEHAGREEAARRARNNAMSRAVNADGTFNVTQIEADLAGTEAAADLPEILTSLNKLTDSANDLRKGAIDADTAAKDHMGALFAAAQAAKDPGDRAGILTQGIAHAQAIGVMTEDEAQRATEALLDEQGQPNADQIDKMIQEGLRQSTEQRTLQSQEATRTAQQNADKALQGEREAKTKAEQHQASLENYSAQLGRATTMEQYQRIYQGIAPEFKDYFDPPESFNPKTSPQRALEASMDAKDILTTTETRRAHGAEEADRAADNARAAGIQRGAVTTAQKAEAERWKQKQLEELEKEFAAGQPTYSQDSAGKDYGTPIPAKDRQGLDIKAMTPTELQRRKDEIQKSYLAQIGQPVAKGSTPAASTTGKIIVTKPGTTEQYAFPSQEKADAALAKWNATLKK